MKLNKALRDMPWPECRCINDRQQYYIIADHKIFNHEKILIVTFIYNPSYYSWYLKDEKRNFRLYISKKNREYTALYQNGRRTTKNLYSLMYTSPYACYPEISAEDEKKIKQLTGKETSNHQIDNLAEWILEVQEKKISERRKASGDIDDEDYTLCPEELPEGLADFIHSEILPEDNTLIYKKGNRKGVCALCRRKVYARSYTERFTQHSFVECPNCGEKVYCVLENSNSWSADFVQNVICAQKGTDGKTIFFRQWHIIRNNDAIYPDITKNLKEVARYAIRDNKVAMWTKEGKEQTFMGRAYIYDRKNWERSRKIYIYDGCYVFCWNGLNDVISGSRLQYADVENYNKTEYRNIVKYLIDVARYPVLEFLQKRGFEKLVRERVCGMSRETANAILWQRVNLKECFRFPLRYLNMFDAASCTLHDIETLNKICTIPNVSEKQIKALLEIASNSNDLDSIIYAAHYKPLNKVIKYLRQQQKKSGDKGTGSIYRDYLKECKELNLDLSEKGIIFPPDLFKAHSETTTLMEYKRQNIDVKKFEMRVKKLKKYEFKKDGFIVAVPKEPQDIFYEGAVLGHCVGTYARAMADGKTAILFIRKENEPETPFYTMEFKNNRIVQCRTYKNESYEKDEQVKAFVDAWFTFTKNIKNERKKVS